MEQSHCWWLSHHADKEVVPLADRHYSRKTSGSPQFTPPGRKLVLKSPGGICSGAYWVTSYPEAQYVKRDWKGAWLCAAFRREQRSPYVASAMIRDAVAITCWKYGAPPDDGMITMIDETKVRPTMVHGVPVWGWCFRKVGFVEASPSHTKGGLLVLQLHPEKMPSPLAPLLTEEWYDRQCSEAQRLLRRFLRER